jgi:hypothetical protein
VTETITKIQDLREGDLYLGPISGWFGPLISLGELIVDGGFHVGPLDVRHVGIVTKAQPGTRFDEPGYPSGVTDTFELTQAMPGGAETVTMTYDQHWTSKVAYVRIPEDYPGQAKDAAAIARLMVEHNVAYSPASYAALAAWHWGMHPKKLEAWIGRRQPEPITIPSHLAGGSDLIVDLPVEAICSVLADQAWTLTGKSVVPDVAEQAVTPSTLATALLSMDGVVWGWPGVHPYTPAL